MSKMLRLSYIFFCIAFQARDMLTVYAAFHNSLTWMLVHKTGNLTIGASFLKTGYIWHSLSFKFRRCLNSNRKNVLQAVSHLKFHQFSNHSLFIKRKVETRFLITKWLVYWRKLVTMSNVRLRAMQNVYSISWIETGCDRREKKGCLA